MTATPPALTSDAFERFTFNRAQPPARLLIGDPGQPAVTIHLNTGAVEFGPGYEPDEAARLFWDAVQRLFRGHTVDLIAEQTVRQEEWDHASELLRDGVKSVSHWEQQVVAVQSDRDRYRLAWLSARNRAAKAAEEAVEAMQEMAQDLYRAEDRLAFMREMCDLADREQRQVTTEQVRAWTQYTGCGGAITLTEQEVETLATDLLAGRVKHRKARIIDAGREPAVLAIPDDELKPLLALADDETEQQ